MNIEKELREILLLIIKAYQFGYEGASEEAEEEVVCSSDGEKYSVLTQESVKKFIQNEKDVIDYGVKKIMELLEKAKEVKNENNNIL